jgi:hypothetical protein
VQARPANRLPYRRNRVPRAVAGTGRFSARQAAALRAIVETYTPDRHDPAAMEVLLVLLEVCRVLGVGEEGLAAVFGAGILHALETWGDAVPPKRRPARLRRVWVWLPDACGPRVYPVGEAGAVRIYGEAPGEEAP